MVKEVVKKHFVIIHGWQGNLPGHWQTFLAKELKQKGHQVSYPQFSNPDYPKLEGWLPQLDEAISKIPSDRKVIVVTHSLSGALWIQYVSRNIKLGSAKTILVAPPLDDCGISEIANFFPLPDIKNLIDKKNWLIVASDNDSKVPFKRTKQLAKSLGVKLHVLHNADHISTKSGYGKWPWIVTQSLK